MNNRPSGGTTLPVTIEAFGIDRLSVPERLDLIEQIWDSLPEQVGPDEVPSWRLAGLAKRRAEADASPGAGRPWREALARFVAGSSLLRNPFSWELDRLEAEL